MDVWNWPQEYFDSFKLHYRGECPYTFKDLGTEITSPVVDGFGTATEFIGRGYIASLEFTEPFAGPTEATVEVAYSYVA